MAIPTLLAGETLRQCLESLTRQTFRDFAVVVIDNSGKRLVRQQGAAKNTGAEIVEMPGNVGFGAAVNRVWQCFPASHLATLNDDAIASPGWLAGLAAALAQHPEAGMFASRVVLLGTGTMDSAGMLLAADGSSKQRGHGEPEAAYEDACEVLLPSGSAALYRSEMLRDTGAFDPAFFLYCEDTDLGLRGQSAGWRCRYVPQAKVLHRYSHSAGTVSALKAYYVERNRLFVAIKNFPIASLWAVPFASLARYGWHGLFLLQGKGTAARFAGASGGWRLAWFVLKAHAALLPALPRLLRQRRAIAGRARVSPAQFAALLERFAIPVRTLARY